MRASARVMSVSSGPEVENAIPSQITSPPTLAPSSRMPPEITVFMGSPLWRGGGFAVTSSPIRTPAALSAQPPGQKSVDPPISSDPSITAPRRSREPSMVDLSRGDCPSTSDTLSCPSETSPFISAPRNPTRPCALKPSIIITGPSTTAPRALSAALSPATSDARASHISPAMCDAEMVTPPSATNPLSRFMQPRIFASLIRRAYRIDPGSRIPSRRKRRRRAPLPTTSPSITAPARSMDAMASALSRFAPAFEKLKGPSIRTPCATIEVNSDPLKDRRANRACERSMAVAITQSTSSRAGRPSPPGPAQSRRSSSPSMIAPRMRTPGRRTGNGTERPAAP